MITKTCAVSGREFVITDDDLVFYEKMGVPEPTLCPEERMRRRTAWRNERNFFKRTCSITGKSVISAFSESCPFPLYERSYWWSDKWDPKDYGRDFDFNRSFFEQFQELQSVVPQLPMMNDDGVGSDNCAFCYDLAFSKDCYLAVGMWEARDCYYTTLCDHGIDLIDCDNVYKSELSYECFYSKNLYQCVFLETCNNCSDCWFGIDLVGCKNCFGCIGLRQKEYYIFNKSYSEKEYKAFINDLNTGNFAVFEDLKEKWRVFRKDFPRQAVYQVQCESCTGDMLYNCQNMKDCHCVYNAQNCSYFIRGDSPRNSYDIYCCGKSDWCYEGVTPDESWMTHFTMWCWKCKEVLYSDNCHSCEHCFGCIGLKRSKYCILNKQYSKEEYFKRKEKIVEHMKKTSEWGEFFPIQLSPFAYNDSVAFDYFPETKERVLERGYKWRDEKGAKSTSEKYNIPNNIVDVEDDILNQALICEKSKKAYRLQKNELGFYKKMKLPIPKLHPIQRRLLRLQQRNSYRLWERKCFGCDESVQTIYAPDRPEKVLCEECYQSTVN